MVSPEAIHHFGLPTKHKIFVSKQPIPHTGTLTPEGVELDPTETGWVCLRVPDHVDASKNMTIILTLESDVSDATAEMLLYIASSKTDNSEAWSWNVENGTAFTFDSTNTYQFAIYTYMLNASDYEAGDLIIVEIKNNDDGIAKVWFLSAEFVMFG